MALLLAAPLLVCLSLNSAAGVAIGSAQTEPQEYDFEVLASECAPDIHINTMKALVRTESGYNPFAIGVVNGRLTRQPKSLSEAMQSVKSLDEQGYNYSVGLGQVNKNNFAAYSESAESLFEPCRNLQVSGSILKGCYDSASVYSLSPQNTLLLALSCYYSGNFKRGFQIEKTGLSYVQLVQENVDKDSKKIPTVPALEPAAGDGKLSPLSHEANTELLAPASSPAKLKKERQSPEWVLIPGSETNPQASIEKAQPGKAEMTADDENSLKDESLKDKKSTAGSVGSRLQPGEFVLIID